MATKKVSADWSSSSGSGTTSSSTHTPSCQMEGWPRVEQLEYGHCAQPGGSAQYYRYCSLPAPVRMEDVAGINKRPLYRAKPGAPAGVHNYYNLMWDGRVRRGDATGRRKKREEEACMKILDSRNISNYKSRALSFTVVSEEKKKKLENVRSRVNSFRQKGSVTPTAAQEESASNPMARFAKLAVSRVAPKDKDRYLVDLSDEIDVMDPCYMGRRLQTLRTFPVAPSRADNLEDKWTQIHPIEFFDFEEEVVPVIERLVGRAVYQARMELLEEEEQLALLNQRQMHQELLEKTRRTIEKWAEREAKVEEERRRQEELRWRMGSGEDMDANIYNACAFSGNMTVEAMNECIENLKKEGFLLSEGQKLMNLDFLPWLNENVDAEVRARITGRELLDLVIRSVSKKKEEEYAAIASQEGYEREVDAKRQSALGPPPRTPSASDLEDMPSDTETDQSSFHFLGGSEAQHMSFNEETDD